jgi:hypothetical protein
VRQYANDTAGLMAGIDAPGLQRQGEGFGYGRLATDINLLGRESQGNNFIDELMVNIARRRNPGLDAAAALLSGLGKAGAGSGASIAAGGIKTPTHLDPWKG